MGERVTPVELARLALEQSHEEDASPGAVENAQVLALIAIAAELEKVNATLDDIRAMIGRR